MKHFIHRPGFWDLSLLIAIVATVVACSWPGMQAPLFADDVFQIDWVKEYRSGWEIFKPDVFGFYRPVKNLLFWLMVPVSQQLWLWHGLGLVAYLLAMFGVARIAEICLDSRRLALFAAVVWALSPTCVSTMVWVSCANISLGLALTAGVVHFHEWALIRGGFKWLCGALVCYAMALLCYESFIMVPGLLFLRDLQQRRLAPMKLTVVRYGCYTLIAVAFLVVRHEFSAKGMGGERLHPGFAPDTTSLQLVLSAPWFLWRHFWMWMMPVGNIELLGSYAWMRSVSMLGLVSSWLFLAAWLATAGYLWKRLPAVSYGLLVFFVASVPSGNFLPCYNGPINDAYVTIPSVGLALVVAFVCDRLVLIWRRRRAEGSSGSIAFAVVVGALVIYRLPACGGYFGYWAGVWKNPTEMVLLMTESRPFQFQLKGVASVKLLSLGYLDPAENLAKETLREAPWSHYGKIALARIAVYRRERDVAELHYRSILGSIGFVNMEGFIVNDVRFELASLLAPSPERREEAAEFCRQILVSRSREKRIPTILLLTRIYVNQGLSDKARATLRRGLQLYPGNQEMTNLLAEVEKGKPMPFEQEPKSDPPPPNP